MQRPVGRGEISSGKFFRAWRKHGWIAFSAPPANRIELLECTLRDGSYAVDFKFTERDTEVLASVLGRLGFRWIEVGHGLGLGAAQAGKGTMPASDERLIESAKRAAPNAMIGSFFIPGIGTREQLRSARSAGLDFVRIGYNAPEVEQAYPYLEFARELGLIPCLNFMKTYGVTPRQFGEKALGGEKAGAAAVYCVDSAGSMFPDDVRGYVGEARQRCQCALGFHGHSNLQFAVANSVEAFRSGARLIDSTLYGLGRSSGNVPTEVAIAVFHRLGMVTGIDLYEVMDAAEEFLGPLMTQIQLYDMMAVSMGYSQFHSSFLPKVAAAARKHGVDLRRLVIAMGELDPVNSNESTLERVAANLPKRKTIPVARGPDFIPRAGNLGTQHQQFAFLRKIVGGRDGRHLRQAARPSGAGTGRRRDTFSELRARGPGPGGKQHCVGASDVRFVRSSGEDPRHHNERHLGLSGGFR